MNLLLSNRMHAKLPGDNKEMVSARSRFLGNGYYEPLLNTLCEEIRRFTPRNGDAVLLDAGCGEGYYTTAAAKAMLSQNARAQTFGVDISKSALHLAARRTKDVSFAVGSVFSLPMADESADIVTEVFAPYCGEEFRRVLKKDGVLLEVIPAARHLFGLKTVLYEKPYENKVKPYEAEGFSFVGKAEVSYEVRMTDKEDIQALFLMTPYAYRTPAEAVKRLNELDVLETEIAFEILAWRVLK